MRKVNLVFGQTIMPYPIGVAGENLATRIECDVSSVLATVPDAFFAVVIARADGATYVAAANLAAVDGILTYVLTSTDTAAPGTIEFEIQASDGDVVIKSWTYAFVIARGLLDGEPPDAPGPDWIQKLIDNAQEGAERAEAAEQQTGEDLDAVRAIRDQTGTIRQEAQDAATSATEALDELRTYLSTGVDDFGSVSDQVGINLDWGSI